MKTIEELKAKFGLAVIPAQYEFPEPTEENPNPEPVEVSPEVDQSEGWRFYMIPTEQVTGNFAEYAASVVDDNCYAFVEDEVLYVATKGNSEAAEITE